MSAIVKPYLTTANTIGDVDPINIEQMGSYSKLDVAASNTQNGRDFFDIIFHMNDAGLQPKNVTWRYASAVLRDTDLTAIDAAVAVTLP